MLASLHFQDPRLDPSGKKKNRVDREDRGITKQYKNHGNYYNCAIEVGGRKQTKKPTDTKSLLKKRRHIKVNNNIQRIEYTELCKTIGKKIAKDIKNYNERLIERAIEQKTENAKKSMIIGKVSLKNMVSSKIGIKGLSIDRPLIKANL